MTISTNLARLGTFSLALAVAAACSTSTDDTGGAGGAAPVIPEARSTKAFLANPSPPAADFAAVVAGSNQLGFDLWAKLGKEDDRILSPASIAAALSMVYAGARGDTAKELAAVLHDGLGQARGATAYNRVIADLAARNIAPHTVDSLSKSVTVRLADAAFVQKGYSLVPAYLDTLAEDYDVGVKLLDFKGDADGSRQTINAWVSYETAQKITNLFGPGTISPDTRLALVNAIYFKGSWASAFDETSTLPATFHAPNGDVQPATMHGTFGMPYVEGEGFKATEIDYDGRELGLMIVLPDEGKLAAVESALSAEWLAKATSGLAQGYANVELALPKFSFSWGSTDLVPPLEALGMSSAFTDGAADFSGIEPSRELAIRGVVHQAFIAVDEKGAEAAAATGVDVGLVGAGGAGQVETKPFVVDRPFFFFLRDTTSGAVLFVGKVSDPK